ncbi:Ig-like domain-containing protein [Paenibacillus hexagrammi]|uniref:Ig-like domain-containing protein n=1 Tax=Paenibacillus hexagrammi TaxID=2908839 RepID=A0ABY3SJA5_9BACL|nr:Ig-like domain-containing protein [Paenibacillus sp. YPD9-1]UJF33605.1 Ig-like domain-containing protein [Paenibacillus sp. YPD9-1]
MQASLDDSGTGLSGKATATITVSAVNDDPVASDDTLDPIAENSSEFEIPISTLLVNDRVGPSNESDQTLQVTSVLKIDGGEVRLDDSKQHVIFTPEQDFTGTASFTYTIQDSGSLEGEATASFTVLSRPDLPTVTNATTLEDTLSTDGLEITPTAAGGATTEYFKITGISGGTLYQHDGMTPIIDGDMINVAEGAAGLKFLT